jgi:hypothetical protein
MGFPISHEYTSKRDEKWKIKPQKELKNFPMYHSTPQQLTIAWEICYASARCNKNIPFYLLLFT